jgi:hypothetical protein
MPRMSLDEAIAVRLTFGEERPNVTEDQRAAMRTADLIIDSAAQEVIARFTEGRERGLLKELKAKYEVEDARS